MSDELGKKIDDLILQATTERSHYYTANVLREVRDTIERLTRERDACVREVSNLGRQMGIAEAERDRLRVAVIGVAASLEAALSIINRAREGRVSPNRVVASDTMFAQMLRDYEVSLDVARAALKGDTQ